MIPFETDLQRSSVDNHGAREMNTLLCGINDGDVLDTVLVKRQRSRHAGRAGANNQDIGFSGRSHGGWGWSSARVGTLVLTHIKHVKGPIYLR